MPEVLAWARRHAVLLGSFIVVVSCTAGLLLLGRSEPEQSPSEVSLTTALGRLDAGVVRRAEIDQAAHRIVLWITMPMSSAAAGSAAGAAGSESLIETSYPAGYEGDVTRALLDADVPTTVAGSAGNRPSTARLLGPATLVLLVLLAALLLVRARGGTLSWGRRSRPVDVPGTTFADVAGCPEAIADLEEIASLLLDPDRYRAAGARTPRGYLLVGPPGTGKTLLARAVAGQAAVPFFATSGADFADMYVGTGKKRVRQLFADARSAAAKSGGAVVFLDEIDAVGRARSAGRRDSASDERDATLIALLTEMDGFDDRGGVVVLAATNRPDALDPALTRPGRFDRRISVPAPDAAGRGQILTVHAARIAVADDVDLPSLGRRTPGLVGADLEALVNEAALEAGRRGLVSVDAACFDEALATCALGRARGGRLQSDRDRKITAWHEAGHAVLALVNGDAQDPMTVTIVPRGGSGGTTWMAGTDEAFLTREQALAQLQVAMGGRAGEELALDGSFSQGAAGDLDSATRLAAAMASEYGMTRLGLARRPAVADGAAMPSDVLEVVNELLAAALDDARSGLREHRALFDALVARLLEVETVRTDELAELRTTYA